MPQFAPILALPGTLAAAATTSLGFSAITAFKVGVIVQKIATFGALYAVSSLLAPRPPKPSAAITEIRQSRPLAPEVIGVAAVAGVSRWYRVSEPDSHALWRALIMSRGPVLSIGRIWLDDVETIAGTGDELLDPAVTGDDGRYKRKGQALVTARRYLGATDQLADTALVAAFPGVLTSDFRARGWAGVVIRADNVAPSRIAQCYPSGAPAVRALVTSKGFDPAGADDPADRLTWTGDGSNAGRAYLSTVLTRLPRIDTSAILTSAARTEWSTVVSECAASVSDGDGGTEPKWRFGRLVDDSLEPADILQSIVDVADFVPYLRADGGLGVMPAAYVAPSGTAISADEIFQATFQRGTTAEARFTRLAASFTDPDNQYTVQAVPTDAVDATLEGLIGVRRDDLGELYTPSLAQARDVMTRALTRRNADKGTIVCAISAMRKWGHRWIEAYLPHLGTTATIEVLGFEPDLGRRQVTIAWALTNNTIDDFDRALDTGPRPPAEGAPAISTAAPTDVTAALVDDGGQRRLQVGWRSLIGDISDFEVRWASASGVDALGQTLYGAWTVQRYDDPIVDTAAGVTANGPRYVAEINVPAVEVRTQVRADAASGSSIWVPDPALVATVVSLDFTGADVSWNGAWIGYVGTSTAAAAGLAETRSTAAWVDLGANEAVASFAASAPRLTTRGLTRQPAITQLLTNPMLTGAVAGTPGTPPTDVTMTGATASVAIGPTVGGDPTVDLTFTGATTNRTIQFAPVAVTPDVQYRGWIQLAVPSAVNTTSVAVELLWSTGAVSGGGIATLNSTTLARLGVVGTAPAGATTVQLRTRAIRTSGSMEVTQRWRSALLCVDPNPTFIPEPIRTASLAAAADAPVVTIPAGLDSDVITITIDGVDHVTTRGQLAVKTQVPLAVGALNGATGIPAGGLPVGDVEHLEVRRA